MVLVQPPTRLRPGGRGVVITLSGGGGYRASGKYVLEDKAGDRRVDR